MKTLSRRQFTTLSAAGVAAATFSWSDLIRLQAKELQKQGKKCILLWMNGGPSQFETFSPLPDHANGGETKAISTAAPGVQIAENLPHTAKVLNDVCVIRSMTSKEGSHPRAGYLLHTSYIPTASVKYPTLGSHVSHQLGDSAFDLPGFVRIGRGRNAGGAGLLGVEYDPFTVNDPDEKPSNTAIPVSNARFRRRLDLLSRVEQQFASNGGAAESADQQKLVAKSSQMILSPLMKTFDVEQESKSMREAYGSSKFASGCLLARRLLESGVSCVEIEANGWDTHADNFNRSRQLCEQVDRPYAQLLKDLKERGLLEDTLVVWMGEFGRTPKINARSGRDHYPRAFNVALAGCGVRGGQVIGQVNPSGTDVADRPVGVQDLFRTIFHALQIDPEHENHAAGRPIKIVEDGSPVMEVFTG